MSRITIKDIARIAGVSASTVSLVLSSRGYVSAKTRQRVEQVIAEQHYHPKQSARHLATGRTGNIGFIVSDIHLSGTEFFYSRVLLGAELEARKRDYYILVTTVDEGFQPSKDAPRFLKSGDVDAVIIAGGVPNGLIEYVHLLKLPYVLVDYKHPSIKSNLIMIENFNGAYIAVNHLIELGRKQIAFVGGSFYHSSIKERFQGYQAALLSSGLDEVASNKSLHFLVQQETSTQIGFDGINELLNQKKVRIDAVICGNDTTAIGCLQALKERHLRIPQDIAVVGFDDIIYAADTDPALTTVHVPKLEMGVQAVRLMLDLIDHPLAALQTRITNAELVVRESTNGFRRS